MDPHDDISTTLMSRGLGRVQAFVLRHLGRVNGWCPLPDLVDAYASSVQQPRTRSLDGSVRRALGTLAQRDTIHFVTTAFGVFHAGEAGGRRYLVLVRLSGTRDTLAGKPERWLYGNEFFEERERWRSVTRSPERDRA